MAKVVVSSNQDKLMKRKSAVITAENAEGVETSTYEYTFKYAGSAKKALERLTATGVEATLID